jgi:hypothetical protein
MQAPDLWFVLDAIPTATARPTGKSAFSMAWTPADSHHTTNSMCPNRAAPSLSDGVFHRTQVETLAAPSAIKMRRFTVTSRGRASSSAIAYGFANPHGRVFDYWGNDIVTDATGNANYFAPAFSGRLMQANIRPCRSFETAVTSLSGNRFS